MGTIIDLSLGGLSCSCVSADCGDCAKPGRDKVDIYCSENKIWIRDLAMEIIGSENTPGQFLDNFWIRKCRVRFGRLRKDQTAQLEKMIHCLAGQ